MISAETSHIRINVTDIDRSRKFYESVFGWPILREVPPDTDEDTLTFLGLPQGGIIYDLGEMLVILRTMNTAAFDEDRIGINHIAFSVADKDALDAAAAHLDAIGVAHEPVRDVGLVYSLPFRDPDNIFLELAAGAAWTPRQ